MLNAQILNQCEYFIKFFWKIIKRPTNIRKEVSFFSFYLPCSCQNSCRVLYTTRSWQRVTWYRTRVARIIVNDCCQSFNRDTILSLCIDADSPTTIFRRLNTEQGSWATSERRENCEISVFGTHFRGAVIANGGRTESEVIMTDSDDDWFEKDIDDFVVKAQPSNVEIISMTAKKIAEPIVTPATVFTDGGNFQ